jgi:hypothetical protein
MQKNNMTVQSTPRSCIKDNIKYPEEVLQANLERRPTLLDDFENELVK